MRRPSPLPLPLTGRPFTVAAARTAGVTPRRLRASDLQSPYRGIRVPAGVELDVVDRCSAVLPTLPAGAVFCHVTALRLLDVEVPWTLRRDDDLHIEVPRAPAVPQRSGLRTHTRAGRTVAHVMPFGLPVLPVEHVWTRLGADLLTDELTVLADAMTRRRGAHVTVRALERTVARLAPGTRGIRRLREALALAMPGTDSSMESRVRLILVHAGLPCPAVNQPVVDAAGRFVSMPDMSYPERRIAIEYDGDIHRTDRAVWRRDIARRQAMEAAGWRVITCTADDVRDPSRLITWVRQALAASSA